MLTIRGPCQRLCEGVGRRDFLRMGALGGLGLSLPDLLHAAAGRSAPAPAGFGRPALRFAILDRWAIAPRHLGPQTPGAGGVSRRAAADRHDRAGSERQ